MKSMKIVAMLAAVLGLAMVASAAPVIETFNGASGGTALTALPSGPWTAGAGYTVVAGGGVNGTNGLSNANPIFNWKAQAFQWSALPVDNVMMMAMDFQTTSAGKFDDDRVGWTSTPDADTSHAAQVALQLDNTGEGGMVVYWNSTRTVLNDLKNVNGVSEIEANTWYRFEVEYTKLTNTSAGIVGTLTLLNASGNKTGTTWVGTVPDTSTFVNPVTAAKFQTASQCPSYKNYSSSAGNADNVYFDANVPEPASMGLLALGGLALLRRRTAK